MSAVTKPIRGLVNDLRSLVDGWQRFWFDPQDVATVCWLRILAGGMILYTHLVWSLELDAFFGPSGWQPADVVQHLRDGDSVWSFWWWVPEQLIWPAHLCCLLILFFFFVGLWTPVTSKLTYLIVVSYAHRVSLANFGLDQINGFLALYLAIAPCGRVASIDWWLERRRRRREASTARETPDDGPKMLSSSARLATRLIQIQLCVLYAYAGVAKLKGDAWWDGNAIWMALANQEYQSTPLMWLARWQPVTELITHATVAWECSFWALVWHPRLRPYVLLVGVFMHLGIGAFLGMWTFGLVMTFAYTAFVPPEAVRSFARGLGLSLFDRDFADADRDGDTSNTMQTSSNKDLDEQPLRIAFIDDNAAVRDQAADYFRSYGMPTEAYATVPDFVASATRDHADVVIVNADSGDVDAMNASLVDQTALRGESADSVLLVAIVEAEQRADWATHADLLIDSPASLRSIRESIVDRIGPAMSLDDGEEARHVAHS